MTPDEYEDITYECNRELGQAEQREIDRRVARVVWQGDGVRAVASNLVAVDEEDDDA